MEFGRWCIGGLVVALAFPPVLALSTFACPFVVLAGGMVSPAGARIVSAPVLGLVAFGVLMGSVGSWRGSIDRIAVLVVSSFDVGRGGRLVALARCFEVGTLFDFRVPVSFVLHLLVDFLARLL